MTAGTRPIDLCLLCRCPTRNRLAIEICHCTQRPLAELGLFLEIGQDLLLPVCRRHEPNMQLVKDAWNAAMVVFHNVVDGGDGTI